MIERLKWLYRNVVPALCVGAVVYMFLNIPQPINTSTTVVYKGTQGPPGIDGRGIDGKNAIATLKTQEIVVEKPLPPINGTDGKDGTNGLSAYEIAVQQGFIGSEIEWLDTLKSEPTPTPQLRCNTTTQRFEWKPNPVFTTWTPIPNSDCVA